MSKVPSILFKGKGILAIHKPSGFLTYADEPQQKPISAQAWTEKKVGQKLFPVHRIDKDTCGILVFATSVQMAKQLTELFRSRVVRKKYLAIVHGKIPEKGTIDEPLKNRDKKMEQAITEYKCLATTSLELNGEMRDYSLVECEPKTGRFHQIRKHLRKLGNPIIGDPEYGNSWDNDVFASQYDIHRTLLSAVEIRYPNREAQKMEKIATKPDKDFIAICDKFSWKLK